MPTGRADEPEWRAWTPGVRVVVRRAIDGVPADAPPPHHTDVVGDLLAVDDSGVLLRTRRDGDVHVPAAAIRLTKVVPPAVPRRSRRPDPGENGSAAQGPLPGGAG